MTDKKFTDEEIIKRLERCVNRGNRNYDTDIVLDLINRQKAEIEKLKAENRILSRNADTAFQDVLDERRELFEPEIKAEAYKEFAERIRECCASNNDLSADTWLSITTDINCVLKELVGEEE